MNFITRVDINIGVGMAYQGDFQKVDRLPWFIQAQGDNEIGFIILVALNCLNVFSHCLNCFLMVASSSAMIMSSPLIISSAIK
jgi:hypothetical protein